MADLDTQAKRASAVMISLPFRGILPAPDGSIGSADRQHLAFLYAGIAASTLIGIGFTTTQGLVLVDATLLLGLVDATKPLTLWSAD